MRIAYLGNFKPAHSTENDVADTLRRMGHQVQPLQEDDSAAWDRLSLELSLPDRPGLVLWTRTASLSAGIAKITQRRMQYEARLHGIPTVGFHLDRWWGLNRETDVLMEPWFRCEYLFTADGDHDRYWEAAGVNHRWSPPAIAERNLRPFVEPDRWEHDVVFVGSWQGGYHDEWDHRRQLVGWLRRSEFNVEFFPAKGEPRVVGAELDRLYATSKVIVGDSCLAPTVDGNPIDRYCSDRVFETIGRGGYLIHPRVPAVTDPDDGLVHEGEHLACWDVGDWYELKMEIDLALEDLGRNIEIRSAGQQWVAAHHTYTQRLRRLLLEAT